MRISQSASNLISRNMKYLLFVIKDGRAKKNGELMKLMVADNFDALLTFDKNLQYQQNFKKYPIPVLILNAPSNNYLKLKNLVPNVKEALNTDLKPGGIEIKSKP